MAQPIRVVDRLQLDDLPLADHLVLQRRAAEIKAVFQQVFMKFADVHAAINHANPLIPDDIQRTGIIQLNITRKYL